MMKYLMDAHGQPDHMTDKLFDAYARRSVDGSRDRRCRLFVAEARFSREGAPDEGAVTASRTIGRRVAFS